jgi:hypothetical protein
MREPLKSPPALTEFADAVFRVKPFNGIGYSSLQLYSETISDKVDAEALVEPEFLSSFWPGGIPGINSCFATICLNQSMNERISEVREVISSLKLSKSALRRWDDVSAPDRRADVEHRVTIPSDEMIMNACTVSDLPFAAISLFRAVHHKFTGPGGRIALLHFPNAIKSPTFALEVVQQAQSEVIEEELF